MRDDLTEGWVLLLEPPELSPHVIRPILGLSLPLRLSLSAQTSGASAIVLHEQAKDLAPLLRDSRLRIPVLLQRERATLRPPEQHARTLRVPANAVVHRAAFSGLTEQCGVRGVVDVMSTGVDLHTPYGFEPFLVVDQASANGAEKALLRSLRKPQDGWTSTHLNRYISLALTRWLVRTPLHPNQVSLGILAIGVLGAFCASRGTYGMLVLGALLFQSQSVLDGCDGEMSRITFRGSKTGEWLDTVGDDLTNYGFFGGAAWGLFVSTGHRLYLLVGGITLLCGIVGSGIEYRYLIRIGSGDLLKYPIGVGQPAQPGNPAARSWVDAISPLFKRDTFVLLTLAGAVLGILGPFLVIFAGGAVGVLCAVLAAERRMKREPG